VRESNRLLVENGQVFESLMEKSVSFVDLEASGHRCAALRSSAPSSLAAVKLRKRTLLRMEERVPATLSGLSWWLIPEEIKCNWLKTLALQRQEDEKKCF